MPYDPPMNAGPSKKADPLEEIEKSAAEDMVKALGIEGADMEAFHSALSDYVRACIQEHGYKLQITEPDEGE